MKQVLLIPNQAIRMLNGTRVVYLQKGEDGLSPASIQLGIRGSDYSEVIGGDVQAGDLVVLNPPPILIGNQ